MDAETANGWLDAHFAPWVRALAPRVEKMACTGVIVSIPVTDEICRTGGQVSGQALATLADTAMVLACAGHFKAFRPVATTNLDVQFLRPANGERISCTATIVRAGRALIFTRAVLTAEPSGKEVATATATMAVPPAPARPATAGA
ncbi:MAG: PaaI family thioesterase [Alphaproteobacteria bacterium]|nr:MAG: PaaI family thioesterase [Alphaproteobacteria bacterium]